jgi:single-stranded-DNA-specific exonuclease
VAIDEKTAKEVRRAFRSYGGRVVHIDHHPLSVDLPGVEVVHEAGSSASELAYRHLGGRLPRLYSRVAPYGAIGDYLDHTGWMEEALEAWDRRLVYFETGVFMHVWSGRGRTTSLSGLWLTTWRGTCRLRQWSAS